MSLKTRIYFSIKPEPIRGDVRRTVTKIDGVDIPMFKEVDYPSLTAKLGSADDWQLNKLVRAGVDPKFPIHTGQPTRLEGVNTVQEAVKMADEIIAETNSKTE